MASQIAPQTNGRPPSLLPAQASSRTVAQREPTWLPHLPKFVRSLFHIADDSPIPQITQPVENKPVVIQQPPASGVASRAATPPQQTRPAGLKRGDSGPRVRELQELLRDNKVYTGESTGVYDAATERAVLDFQASYSGPDGAQINDDGVAGENTLAALRANKESPNEAIISDAVSDYAHLGEDRTLRANAVGIDVTRAQTLLRELGYGVQVTGHYDQQTNDAVIDFQQRYNRLTHSKLDCDGAIGPSTGYAMLRAAEATVESTGSWLNYAQMTAVRSGQGALPPAGVAPVPMPSNAPAPTVRTTLALLKQGSTDKVSVTLLQNQLRTLGYDISPDGDYGLSTTAAISDFQRLYSMFSGDTLAVDGAAGNDTRQAIEEAMRTNLMGRLPATLRNARVEVGYNRGVATRIVTRAVSDGGRMETRAALAYYAMQQMATRDGKTLATSESFRTYSEQRSLYNAYIAARRRGQKHAVAARPGWSNHQFGIAVDIRTVGEYEGTLSWLNAQARSYGFRRTVSSEPWHWEYRVDRLPNAVRRFYGLTESATDAVTTAPMSIARRRRVASTKTTSR